MTSLRAVLALVGVACVGGTTTDGLVCPRGGPDVLPVSEEALPTCADVAERYDLLVSTFRSCTSDAQCQVLNGQCGTSLGGCYEAVNLCLDQSVLSELGALNDVHTEGCVGAVCRCAAPPGVTCSAAGVCELSE